MPNRQIAKPNSAARPTGAKLQRACACGKHTADGAGECAECKHTREQGVLQRAAIAPAPDAVPPIVHDVLRSPGQPLDPAARAFMEPRFGHDFGDVRVHTDRQAAESARAVNALAYTVGSHVAFGAGQYQPASAAGQRLLAHELAHVVQQGAYVLGSASPLKLDEPQSHAEEQAARHSEATFTAAADAVTSGSHSSPLKIQRQKDAPAATASAGAAAPTSASSAAGAQSGWTLEDPQIDFEISHQRAREASFLMLGGAATGPGFTEWSNRRIFVITPPEHSWLHTGYWVDTAQHALPEDQQPFSVFNDIKYTTSSGQKIVDLHYSDSNPAYQGPGQALKPKLGFTSPANPDLPVCDLPLNEGGQLQWRAGFNFKSGAKRFEVGGTFQVQPPSMATPAQQEPSSTATGSTKAPLASPGAKPETKEGQTPAFTPPQNSTQSAVGEIKELTELVKKTSDAVIKDALVKKLRDTFSRLQPVIPASDAQKAIDDAIRSLIKDGTDQAILALLKGVTGKSPSAVPENRDQTGPDIQQKDLNEHILKGPKIPIKDAPALPPKLSFQYKNGPQKTYAPGAPIKFTLVPPDNFYTLQGAKRLVIVAEAERKAPNAERLARVQLESNTTRIIELQAPLKPGKYVIRVDIGLSFDDSSIQEFEVVAPQAK